ncbi:MAG: hypothetical protein ACLT8E_07110 [Akkermansia sp.]
MNVPMATNLRAIVSEDAMTADWVELLPALSVKPATASSMKEGHQPRPLRYFHRFAH